MQENKISLEVLKEKLADVQFFMYASPGAMGMPGYLFYMTSNAILEELAYMALNLNDKDVLACLPAELEGKWEIYNLGHGNLLYMRPELLPAFQALVEDPTPWKLYPIWRDLAYKVVSEKFGTGAGSGEAPADEEDIDSLFEE